MLMRGLLILVLCPVITAMAAGEPPPSLPGLVSYHMPRFPPELVGAKAGDGDVVLVITIDAQGKISDSVALEATNEVFAKAAINAVTEYWEFTPVAGDTWPRREVLQFNFKRSGVVTTLSHAEGAREGFKATSILQLRTVPLADLDSQPQRLNAPMPKISKAALAARGDSPLVINFVIDRDGSVRVPAIAGVDDSELAESVLSAVRQWRYSPPLHQNQPVAVEITRALVLPNPG